MTLRTRTAAIATATVTAIAAAAAIPALTGAQSPGPRDFTVRMKVISGTEIHHGRGAKLATGDEVVIRLAMSNPEGAALGTASAHCVNVGRKSAPDKATFQCVQTYKFNDGQLVIAGIVNFSELENLSISVVGGSGAYRGARGHMTQGQPVPGFDSVDVVHLDG